jgi:hypothetical protein
MKYFSSSTLFLQFLQNLSGTGNGGFIYLPVSIACWWALILILVNERSIKFRKIKTEILF